MWEVERMHEEYGECSLPTIILSPQKHEAVELIFLLDLFLHQHFRIN